ncbi:hypothetical protein RF11_08475 [Thelohanellus kitauei]|uniref:Uncharacterized protein n=1 Tax=Thelohanellus kitauei TaxID=669202 RepID=A0A0C2IWP1_THEKT|nr:hypothetical protein RF11_08475 [Thelohanellus kitauei]
MLCGLQYWDLQIRFQASREELLDPRNCIECLSDLIIYVLRQAAENIGCIQWVVPWHSLYNRVMQGDNLVEFGVVVGNIFWIRLEIVKLAWFGFELGSPND